MNFAINWSFTRATFEEGKNPGNKVLSRLTIFSAESLFDPFSFSVGETNREHSEKRSFLRPHETCFNEIRKCICGGEGEVESGGEAIGREREEIRFLFEEAITTFHSEMFCVT